MHGVSADGTVPVGGRAGVISRGCCGWSREVGGTGEQQEAEWQQEGASSVGEEAEVADAHEAARQQVEQEAAQEFIDRQSEQALLVGVGGVSPAEGDLSLLQCDQSAVGDGDAVSVGAEIAQRVFRAAEGWLGVDDPLVAEQRPGPCGEGSWIRKSGEVSMELELVMVKGSLQSVVELATKDATECLDREEESVAGWDPAQVVGSEASRGGDAVDMGMSLEALVPGMEHAEEANLRAQVAGIASELQQGCSTGLEQQVVDHSFVLESEGREFTGQREDQMHVAGGQQFLLACLEPAHASVRLASGAMPVPARVEGDGSGVAAGGTAIAMATESGGATAGNRQQHLLVLPGDPAAAAFDEASLCTANDIGHLQRRPIWMGHTNIFLCDPS
jgi:hypothetical protein